MSIRNKLGVAPPKKHVPTVKEAVATTSSLKRVRKSNERFATKIVEQKQTDAENTFKEELDRIANEAAYKRQEEELVALARTDRLDRFDTRIRKIEDYTQERMEYFEKELDLSNEPVFNDFVKKFYSHIRKIDPAVFTKGWGEGHGGGGIGDIGDAGDIDTGTAKVDGKFLKYDASQSKWVGDDATVSAVFKTISISGQDDVVADADTDTLTIAASSGISVTTTAASDTITFGIDIDSATDGTSITIADTDKILIDDSGTTKYVNASQVETYINPKGKAIAMAIVFG